MAAAWFTSEEERLVLWGVFSRGIAAIFVLSFVSLRYQVLDLAGTRGIYPLAHRLAQLDSVYTSAPRGASWVVRVATAPLRVLRRCAWFPTVFWAACSDAALVGSTVLGAGCSAALVWGGWSPSVTSALFAIVWLLYLSLDMPVGLAYPWDSLLLSLGFLAITLPPVAAPSLSAASTTSWLAMTRLPNPQIALCVRWLFVRLLLGFGKLKFMGTDARHHCYIRGFLISQPMPTKTGWLMHHLPLSVHKLALLGMFVIEIVLPPLAFVPGLWRQIAAFAAMALMVGIQLSGNFGYFNVLTAVMAVAVLDPVSSYTAPPLSAVVATVTGTTSQPLSALDTAVAIAFWPYIFATLWAFLFNSWVNLSWLQWPTVASAKGAWKAVMAFLGQLSRWRAVNAFGVFPPASAPPLRWVVIMEGSADGETWHEYHWAFMTSGKGDSIAAAPRFIAPHHPRIDHSIFYASFGVTNANLLSSLTAPSPFAYCPHASPERRIAFRLLQGETLPAFFSHSPFPQQGPDATPPPTFVRASLYVYSPASLAAWWRSGCRRWWNRQRVGLHMAAITIDDAAATAPAASPLPDPERSQHAVARLPSSFPAAWCSPPETYHPDATPAWKAHAPALATLTRPTSSVTDSVIIMRSGSCAAACWGGIRLPTSDDALVNLFWTRFITAFRLPTNAAVGSLPRTVFTNLQAIHSTFSPVQLLQIELALSRLSLALLSRWAAVYYDTSSPATDPSAYRSRSDELRAALRAACRGHDSYFVLYLLSLFTISRGTDAYEAALANPAASCLANATHASFALLPAAYLDMAVHPFMWRYMVRKMTLGRAVMNTKTPEQEAAEARARATSDKPDLLPGFPNMTRWVASEDMHVALGLQFGRELDIPRVTKPAPGGKWAVHWRHA